MVPEVVAFAVPPLAVSCADLRSSRGAACVQLLRKMKSLLPQPSSKVGNEASHKICEASHTNCDCCMSGLLYLLGTALLAAGDTYNH